SPRPASAKGADHRDRRITPATGLRPRVRVRQVCIPLLKGAATLRDRMGICQESAEITDIAAGTKIATLRRSGSFPGAQRAVIAAFLRLISQGLIHIVAELGMPSAYPGPGSRVIRTLYAWREEDPLRSDNVWTRIVP